MLSKMGFYKSFFRKPIYIK